MPRIKTLIALAIAAALIPAASAAASPHLRYRPDEVVVKYRDGTPAAKRGETHRATGTRPEESAGPQTEVLHIADGQSVGQTTAELNARPDVEYAVPNPIAHIDSGFFPNDHGQGRPGDWRFLQWNLLAGPGIDAPNAWSNLLAAHAPGGRGVTIAILDTGVAYENRYRFRRSPDFSAYQFVRGYDFVARDPYPDDENGHGTFVASLIGERTHNYLGLAGIAYGAKLMPVRVLDRQGLGDAAVIAAGIRYAAIHGARVINLSLEFDSSVPGYQIPEILSAIRFARTRGALVVGSAGNEALNTVSYPARAPFVTSVGATTEHVCQADYSNGGPGLDLVAPGGGGDAAIPSQPDLCRPGDNTGRDIFALTYNGSIQRFGLPNGYEGTSMAAPHVSAVAALIIASRVIGIRPSAYAVELRLKNTARDLGVPGWDPRYGAGLLDAGAATRRG